MSSNSYHFVTEWQFEATIEEITEILSDAEDLSRWWPSVYLDVQEVEPGDESGIGKVVKLYTKGWLPYTLRWQFRIVETRPDGWTLEAWGDFVGRGIWTFRQDGAMAHVRYDWRISAEKPLLRYLSFVMKPIFAANHHWAMRQGKTSLKLELARRREQAD
jgi:hypothetical protein